MFVFRLTLSHHGKKLYAPGLAGRWNLRYDSVIYAASSRSLALLENIAHRGGEGTGASFVLFTINIPDTLAVETILPKQLPRNWKENYAMCQEKGTEWIRSQRTAVLKVPSVIVPEEENIVLNFNHPDFHKITVSSVKACPVEKRFYEALF